MNLIKQTKRIISGAMAILLAGGLLLTPGEQATAQGGVVSGNQEIAVATSSTTLSGETQTQPSPLDKKGEESSTSEKQDTSPPQGKNTVTPSAENEKITKPVLPEEQLSSVTGSVYLQASDSRRATLNVLAAAEQIRNQKRQLPSEDAVRELPDRRTANSKHYLMKDGSYQAIISMGQEHYEDESGELQDIVPFLIDEADMDLFNGKVSKDSAPAIHQLKAANQLQGNNTKAFSNGTYYRAPQVPFDLKLSKQFTDGYSIAKDGSQLSFIPQQANTVTGQVYDLNKIQYSNVWNETDVMLTVTNDSLKEDIIVRNSNAPTQFTYEVIGGLDENGYSGSLSLSPMWLFDANGKMENVEQIIRKEGGRTFLDISFDPTSLAYPIIIDPTVSINSNADGIIEHDGYNGSWNTFYPNYTYLMVGSQDSISWLSDLKFDFSSIQNVRRATSYSIKLSISSVFPTSGDMMRFLAARIKTNSGYGDYYTTLTDATATMNINVGTNQFSFDVTKMVQSAKTEGNSFFGVRLIDSGSGRIVFHSIESGSSTAPALIISYNGDPTVPTLISPNGGEKVDQNYTIAWSASNDPETVQSELQYQVQLSTDGGNSFTNLVALTSKGQTSLTYDFSNIAATSNAIIRVRCYDGGDYGVWDQSDAPFTIQHNRAPNAPSGLNPGSISSTAPTFVAGVTPTLNWTFSDPDAGDTQSAYQVLLYNTSNGLVYDSGWVTSSAKSFTVPTNKLVRGTAYYWKVLVKDSKGAVSSASNTMYIKCNTIPTLNLTSYANNTSVPDNVLTFTWTFTDGDGQAQSAVQIQGSKDNFATIAYNSGTINGTATSFTTPALASGTWSFRVMATDGVEWSAYSQRTGLSLPNTFEPNDSTATATPVSYGTYTTLINSTTDVDFFKYTASTTGVNRVQLTPPAGKNYDVYVYDSSNTLLAAGVRSAGVSENIIYEVAAGSTYYVKVVGISGEYSTTATYSLTISNVNFKTQTTYDYDSNGNLKTTTVVP